MSIGVAVADHPTGPFRDALGKPLLSGGWGYIDPAVFIDTNGEAYLYWGNPHLYYVKLNPDMVSFDQQTGIVKSSPHGCILQAQDHRCPSNIFLGSFYRWTGFALHQKQ